jgi:hypothetical protein
MDRDPVQRESFVVRVWWKPGQAAPEVWAQHVRSGEAAVMHDLSEVAAFIERWAPLRLLAPAAQARVSGTGQAKLATEDRQGLR